LHQSILLTQGPIHEILQKILRIGNFEKLTFFELAILFFDFQKNQNNYPGFQPKITPPKFSAKFAGICLCLDFTCFLLGHTN
jgi:hypothetical protein